MKVFNYLTISILFAFISVGVMSCSDSEEQSSGDIRSTLQQYKWEYRTSDEPLVDDDYQWGIFDDYVITLYFVSDYECVIRYFRKHFDTDDGTSYERDAQTVRYTTQGSKVILETSAYTELEFVFNGGSLVGKNSVYTKEAISSSDREWIDENFMHIEPNEDESKSVAFKGLKEVTCMNEIGGAKSVIGNFQCDEFGRLIYYRHRDWTMRYEYSNNMIISKYSDFDSSYDWAEEKNTYTLTNGLITSFTMERNGTNWNNYKQTYRIKYDNNKRITQIVRADAVGDVVIYKWNSAGNIYETNTYYYDELSNIDTYEYYSSLTQIPTASNTEDLLDAYFGLDFFLLIQGYFGKSIPKNNLKSSYKKKVGAANGNMIPYDRDNYKYSFDVEGRCSQQTHDYEYLYSDRKYKSTYVYTFNWE